MRRSIVLTSLVAVFIGTLPSFAQVKPLPDSVPPATGQVTPLPDSTPSSANQNADQSGAGALTVTPLSTIYYDRGVQCYKNRQAQQAVTWFSTAVASTKDPLPNAHYYLGNCYLMLGRTEMALAEYKTTYAADPTGEAGFLSRNAIASISNTEEKSVADQSLDAAVKAAVTAVSKLPAPHMPALPSAGDPHPNLYEIQHWTEQLRSDYVNSAQDRVPQAEATLFQARLLLARAETAAASFGSGLKKKGENATVTKKRATAIQKRINALVQPYRDYVSACERQLSDSRTIYNACLLDCRKLTGSVPFGRSRQSEQEPQPYFVWAN